MESEDGPTAGVVIDVSVGGVWLELPPNARVPSFGARAHVTLERDGHAVTRRGRVVRLRLAGRERGRPMPRACAWVFDDGDDDAEHRLARLLDAR